MVDKPSLDLPRTSLHFAQKFDPSPLLLILLLSPPLLLLFLSSFSTFSYSRDLLPNPLQTQEFQFSAPIYQKVFDLLLIAESVANLETRYNPAGTFLSHCHTIFLELGHSNTILRTSAVCIPCHHGLTHNLN